MRVTVKGTIEKPRWSPTPLFITDDEHRHHYQLPSNVAAEPLGTRIVGELYWGLIGDATFINAKREV